MTDVKGTFLLGDFQNNETIYFTVPEGWEPYFPPKIWLPLLKTICSLKQAAYCFYKLLVIVFRLLGFAKSQADPALFYKWHSIRGLIVCISWVDDLAWFSRKEDVLQEIEALKKNMPIENLDPLKNYLGVILNSDIGRSAITVA